MKHFTNYKCYQVYKNQTNVSVVSINDFTNHQVHRPGNIGKVYTLPPEKEMFTGYSDLVTALEKAKVGALAHITKLISRKQAGLSELLQYRIDHYEDLNVNLLDANIRKIEDQLRKDSNFQWVPYRIQTP
ncbi:hypothetical protein [Pedobacter psychroterrae]|uniref:Uncharacterized protein n=1 Tax=Pedobacter psychroterrae TaxID=2530453 RepID=A0A4R0NC39_9SPHI|nr:hypothetical protein [Pedobacter psychroterrae]TCC96853.1 hypothetical protein EZ437_20940 [Pedobacter psychroterrae]